jgi:hypothetical protein
VGRNAIGIYMREVWRSPETSVRPLRVGRSDTARLPHTPHTCHPRDPDGSKRAESRERHEDERRRIRLAKPYRADPIIRSNFPAKLPVYKLSSTPRGRAHSTQVIFDTRILVLMSCGPASSRVSRPCRASSRRRLPLRPPPGPHGARTMRLDADWMLIQLIVGCEACETGETANGMLTGCEGSEAFSTPVTQ